ncbi:zinc finger protein 106-like [Scleropages formosus]|uniref:Zinc finger protein 106-like n=2 Tax=Scleropages formosus TaxID=113540 RepID=A0A8C9UY14_SCLFO|nr:zinc finger protein 106-like [Scleropages formosus]
MARERKCILCRTIYNTKQEMDEHMRSMLHHRELENLKGRDCDHECRVCRVSVVGLTGYASHISSPLHKHQVEQHDQGSKGSDSEEEYFDQELVDLIEKRRKLEEEAKQAMEENQRKQQLQNKGFSQHGAHMGYPMVPMMQEGYGSPNWQIHRSSSQGPNGGAHHPGESHFSEQVGMWPHGQKFHPSHEYPGRPLKFQKWSMRGVGFRGSQGAQNNWHHEGQGCPPQQMGEFSHPYMSHQNQGSWEWLPMSHMQSGMDLDFTNDHLPHSCRFDPSSEVEFNHGAYQAPYGGIYRNFQGRQQTMGRSRGIRGKGKGSKFWPFKQNRWTSYNWDTPEQYHEIMWKAKKALQNKDSFATEPEIQVHHVEEPLSSTSSGLKPGSLTVEKSMKKKDPIKASSHLNRKGTLKESHLTSSLQSVQITTSTSENPGEIQPSALEGHQSQEEEVEDGDTKKCTSIQKENVSVIDEVPGSERDTMKEAQAPVHGPVVPDLRKLGLPASLKWDLTRHSSKAGGHEPNLNAARRIRNISELRKSEAEKDLGLRPTLRQLISSSGSRRIANWDQVYHEVCKKKQKEGKGMPRFGIEMVPSVPSDPEVLNTEEDEISLSEGYQWESFSNPSSAVTGFGPRKRSFSESNLGATDPESGSRESSAKECRLTTERLNISPWGSETSIHCRSGQAANRELEEVNNTASLRGDGENPLEEDTRQEQNDFQDTDLTITKDNPSFVVVSSEQRTEKQKDVKVISTESSQVDQLLAVSLREEELNSSLQTLESSLIQGRAALQAAYMEMQRLLMVKQQITTEMNALRAKRIEILQGMQEGYDGGSKQTVKKTSEVVSPAVKASPALPPSCTIQQDALSYSPSQLPPAGLPHILHQAVPLSSMSPAHPTPATTTPLFIKQEPVSPTRLDSDPDPAENPQTDSTPSSSSTAQCIPRAEQHGSVVVSIGHSQEDAAKGWSSSGVQSHSSAPAENQVLQANEERCVSVSEESVSDPCQKTSSKRSGGEIESHVLLLAHASSPDLTPEQSSPSSAFMPKGKKINLKNKKKWKIKKKGKETESYANNAQNGNVDQSANACSTFSTKTNINEKQSGVSKSSPTKEKQEEEEGTDCRKKSAEAGNSLASTGVDHGASDSDSSSSLAYVELPEAPPPDIVSLDSSDAEDEQETCGREKSPSLPGAGGPSDSGRAKPKGLACNEVSSTSELNTGAGSQNSDTQMPSASTIDSKKCSGVSMEPTEGSFEGHKQAVTALQIHGGCLYTCSEDHTVRVFSLVSRQCVEVFEGHSAKVNCLFVSSGPDLQHRLYTGSSDQTICCYSLKTRECEKQFSLMDRVLCLHSRWKILYAGLANGCVVSVCLKSNRQLDVFECHSPRAVSCLASTQEGARRLLLVGSYDCTISVRDAKSGLLLRTLKGHTKTVLCMKVSHEFVYSGSSDWLVQCHNIHTGELKRIYKGHNHAVTVVAVLGKVMITACLDKLVRVYELQSHDRLQVYGGHKDMVMCMAIHKSMIYTGCYDGSIQAVRLNLMQNYRCWWHGCTLIFGVVEHLHQHLLTDHTSPTFQVMKCRWKGCEAFFSVRNGTKEDLPKHMQKHAEEDSSPET